LNHFDLVPDMPVASLPSDRADRFNPKISEKLQKD